MSTKPGKVTLEQLPNPSITLDNIATRPTHHGSGHGSDVSELHTAATQGSQGESD